MRKFNSIELRIPWQRLPEPPPKLHRLIRHFTVLLQGRLRLFFIVDTLLILFAVSNALVDSGEPGSLFRAMVILPNLILLVPTLASLIDLERRSGTLDLALSVRNTESYFVRRALSVVLLIVVQSSILILLIEHPRPTSNLIAIVFAALITATFAAIVLFWAVRLESSGAVMIATYVTTLVLGKWIFFQPFPPRFAAGMPNDFLGVDRHYPLVLWNCLVLAGAAVILYLYARRRIRRPQSLL